MTNIADGQCPVQVEAKQPPANPRRGTAKTSGDAAELAVARWLEAHGLTLLEHQYNVPRLGELDLVMRRGDCLYFIEVKARSDLDRFGGGLGAITAAKLRKLRKTALHYCQKTGSMNLDLRFLAAEVALSGGQPQGPIRIVPME
jgi:putative endonuclease